MIGLLVSGIGAGAGLGVGSSELATGALIGALFVGAAYLAGAAALGRAGTAICALVMLLAAGALEAVWLGVAPTPSPAIVVFLQGLLAASVLVFLSSSVRLARDNAIIGGVLFTAALSLLGVGVINFVLEGELAGLMRNGLAGVAFAALAIAGWDALQGDEGARFVLPGAVLTVLALVVASTMGGAAFLPHALFTVGLLTASLAAIGAAPRMNGGDFGGPVSAATVEAALHAHNHGHSSLRPGSREEQLRVSENQLAQVLDYSGLAVWDWCSHASHQSASFANLMGASNDGAFTPDAMKAFIDPRDAEIFEREVLGASGQDGGFDVSVRLVDGRSVRMRGARAVSRTGGVERVVMFLEQAAPRGDDLLKTAAASLAATAATAGQRTPADAALAAAVSAALDAGEITPAFQPIVALDGKTVVGHEALVRWPARDAAGEGAPSTEAIVRAAAAAGRSGDLARLMLAAAADRIQASLKETRKPPFCAFNIAARDLSDQGFVEAAADAMATRGLPAKSIVLEVTEAERLGDSEAVATNLANLRKAGLALAFDDFGAGFSHMADLSRHAFDYLKIDKSFVARMANDDSAAKIVRALAGLGRELGLTVIAEGVDSESVARAARSAGCALGQGYHLGEPRLPGGVAKPAALEAALADATPKPEAATAQADGAPESAKSESASKSDGADSAKPARGLRRRLFAGGELR